jgi:E3 ubiquitin-protein ligase CCNP1IP1
MQVDQDGLRRKNEELVQTLREKSRKQLQTQELYDKLKRRAMLGEVQNAAFDAVDHNIRASVAANRFVDRVDNQNQNPRPPPPPLFSHQQTGGMQHLGLITENNQNVGAQIGKSGHREDTWAGLNTQGTSQRMLIPFPSTTSSKFVAREPPHSNPFHAPSALSFGKRCPSTDWTCQFSWKCCLWSTWSPHAAAQSFSSAASGQSQRK